jgi:hypothetical protein
LRATEASTVVKVLLEFRYKYGPPSAWDAATGGEPERRHSKGAGLIVDEPWIGMIIAGEKT